MKTTNTTLPSKFLRVKLNLLSPVSAEPLRNQKLTRSHSPPHIMGELLGPTRSDTDC